jgi:hypothetical protein
MDFYSGQLEKTVDYWANLELAQQTFFKGYKLFKAGINDPNFLLMSPNRVGLFDPSKYSI